MAGLGDHHSRGAHRRRCLLRMEQGRDPPRRSQMGKLATLLLYSAIVGLYIAVGFEIAWGESVFAVVGLVGIVLYYAVGIAYFGDLLAAIKSNEAA